MFNPSGVEKRRQGFDAMLLNSPEAALDRVYVALDLETTGLNADRHKIIEVGAVKFRGPEVIDVFETFVNPYTSIPQFVGRLTGIRQRDVDTAPPFAAVAGRLGDFVGGLPVIGHNVAFDMGFLGQARTSSQQPYLRYVGTWRRCFFLGLRSIPFLCWQRVLV